MRVDEGLELLFFRRDRHQLAALPEEQEGEEGTDVPGAAQVFDRDFQGVEAGRVLFAFHFRIAWSWLVRLEGHDAWNVMRDA